MEVRLILHAGNQASGVMPCKGIYRDPEYLRDTYLTNDHVCVQVCATWCCVQWRCLGETATTSHGLVSRSPAVDHLSICSVVSPELTDLPPPNTHTHTHAHTHIHVHTHTHTCTYTCTTYTHTHACTHTHTHVHIHTHTDLTLMHMLQSSPGQSCKDVCFKQNMVSGGEKWGVCMWVSGERSGVCVCG